jgi:hypothetical protein
MGKPCALVLCFLAPLGACLAQPSPGASFEDLAQGYLWPRSEADFRQLEAKVKSDASLTGVSRERFHDLEEVMRRGRRDRPPAPAAVNGKIPLQEISMRIPGGFDVPVLVQLPQRYRPDVEWPLMFAMHGGPPGSLAQARSGAERMIRVWSEAADQAGWIVAAPALVMSVTAGQRTPDRLPYEILHPEQAKALFTELRNRYSINPDRIVSTGISLGSNYSIVLGTSHPDWLSAIVPVSTEGDSREHLLRNLSTIPAYILEGSKDKNIRKIDGPRALRDIVSSFGYDLTYREFGDRAHEGFQEHYPDVLAWLDLRPRQSYPREVVRVPSSAITLIGRRRYWVEADTDQALFRARVTGPTRIEITARWARELRLYLSDRLLNLDAPIEIWVNGVRQFSGEVKRSVSTALEQARGLQDERRVFAAELTVRVPETPQAIAAGRKLWEEMKPTHPEGTLSFWESFAAAALHERFPSTGLDGTEEKPPRATGELTGVKISSVAAGSPFAAAGVRGGDLMLSVGGEPFFSGNGGLAGLEAWMRRALRAQEAEWPVVVLRDGKPLTLSGRFQLGPYRSGATVAK